MFKISSQAIFAAFSFIRKIYSKWKFKEINNTLKVAIGEGSLIRWIGGHQFVFVANTAIGVLRNSVYFPINTSPVKIGTYSDGIAECEINGVDYYADTLVDHFSINIIIIHDEIYVDGTFSAQKQDSKWNAKCGRNIC